ncbi:hypothetical protein M3I54_22590 [Paraburkholderia sp. CNPSo 3274]|uniref:hypothetical protein n=1 Tax=Paraburkholderia sp. CNPSo 3274 TaxID=2940932 RepID=UPI0020B80DEF|nr:hypothetical protein [Paraburkholderia sp. CNPSo 3274]MCP3709735.1 hypothetical protein [Paraburkholderia sp. CNPSo 3274]
MSKTATVVTSETLMQRLTGEAPAATPAADAAPATPAPEKTGEEGKTGIETPVGQESPQQQPKKKPLIEELVRTRHERNDARTEAEVLRAELAELREQMQAAQATPAPKEPDPKPERAQFVTEADYHEALTDWKVDQKLAERQQEEQQARMQAAQQQLADSWDRRGKAARETMPDYDDVVGKSEIDLPNPIYMAIVESDYGHELAYYLAKNPDEARLLRGMSLTSAVRMLGKLEDRLAADKAPAKKDAPAAAASATPEKSKAPAPIEPLSDASGSAEKPTSQMTYAEYKAMRQQQEAARRKR